MTKRSRMKIFNTILLLLSLLFMVVTESKMYLVKTKSKSSPTETVNPTPSCTCGRAMAITKNKILSRIVGGIETKVLLSHTAQYVICYENIFKCDSISSV